MNSAEEKQGRWLPTAMAATLFIGLHGFLTYESKDVFSLKLKWASLYFIFHTKILLIPDSVRVHSCVFVCAWMCVCPCVHV